MRTADVAVIGAGAAGLAAATHAARAGLSVVVIESTGAGGQVMNVDRIDNYPGQAEPLAGYELGPLLQEQAEAAGAEFMLDTVTAIEPDAAAHRVVCGAQTVLARAVIVAAGSSRRELGVPGEQRLQGRGVSHCASCDGPLYRGLHACVVGGGDAAADEAMALAAHARQVTLIHRGAAPTAQPALVQRLREAGNVAFLADAEVEAIEGDDVVRQVVVRRGEARSTIEADGVFVNVGLVPNTGFVAGLLALDADGRIVCDARLRTSVSGIYAAGDLRAGSPAMLASSAEDGAVAAQSVLHALGRQTAPQGGG